MLSHVSVKDIALIDSVELELDPGLTVLTGETGAGKSILVEALLLLLGARASAESVRQGASEGSVQAQLQLAGSDAKEVARILAEHELPPLEDGALVLRRVISREGRHKQFVNGALATVAQLKAVAEPLVDFTGQHAHQQLLRPGAQETLLDAFGGHDSGAPSLCDEMAGAHKRARDTALELRALREKNAEKERRLDVIRFYLDEIEALAPEPGEDERLASEHKRLKNAAAVTASLGEAREHLIDGGASGGGAGCDALTLLQRGLAALSRAAKDDEDVVPLVKSLAEAVALVDDVGRTLGKLDDVTADPQRLQWLDDRLDALNKLKKKHGGDLAGVLAAREQLAIERGTLEGAAERIDHLEGALRAHLAAAAAVADRLTAKRKAAGKKLAAAVQAELVPLGMPKANLAVLVEPLAAPADAVIFRPPGADATAARGALTARGSDRVELLFSANLGEAPAPLSKVASGGELSRVLLAVKRALLVKDPVPVSIFDEVDAGVGGAVGEAIAEKLQAIADGRQVFVISHLPQIAAKADQHLVAEKALDGGRTVSRVRKLSQDARADELSRMLGGKVITAATRRHAEEMLALGRAGAASSRSKGAAPKKRKSA